MQAAAAAVGVSKGSAWLWWRKSAPVTLTLMPGCKGGVAGAVPAPALDDGGAVDGGGGGGGRRQRVSREEQEASAACPHRQKKREKTEK